MPHLQRLQSTCDLSACELDALLICLALLLDLRYERIDGYLQDNATATFTVEGTRSLIPKRIVAQIAMQGPSVNVNNGATEVI